MKIHPPMPLNTKALLFAGSAAFATRGTKRVRLQTLRTRLKSQAADCAHGHSDQRGSGWGILISRYVMPSNMLLVPANQFPLYNA